MSLKSWIKKKLTPKPDVLYVTPQLGGSGICQYCGKYMSNIAFHESRCMIEQSDAEAALSAALKVLEQRAKKRKQQGPAPEESKILEDIESEIEADKADPARSIKG